jgi:hypothetical protein
METGKWVAITGLAMLSLFTLMKLKEEQRKNRDIVHDLKITTKLMNLILKDRDFLEKELENVKQQSQGVKQQTPSVDTD